MILGYPAWIGNLQMSLVFEVGTAWASTKRCIEKHASQNRRSAVSLWVEKWGWFHKWGSPMAGWFIRENSVNMDDVGIFWGTPISGNPLKWITFSWFVDVCGVLSCWIRRKQSCFLAMDGRRISHAWSITCALADLVQFSCATVKVD